MGECLLTHVDPGSILGTVHWPIKRYPYSWNRRTGKVNIYSLRLSLVRDRRIPTQHMSLFQPSRALTVVLVVDFAKGKRSVVSVRHSIPAYDEAEQEIKDYIDMLHRFPAPRWSPSTEGVFVIAKQRINAGSVVVSHHAGIARDSNEWL